MQGLRATLGAIRRLVLLRVGLTLLSRHGPTPLALRLVHRGWGNQGFSSSTDYLRSVLDAAPPDGRILECGSGLTTVAMSALGHEVWALEHDADWARRVSRASGSDSVRVRHAPLRSYGEVDWYELPPDLPDQFALVVCDGPPSTTAGGRSGLWMVARDRIRGAAVLLDDADRPDEAALIHRLQSEGWTAELNGPDCRRFAVLRLDRTSEAEGTSS